MRSLGGGDGRGGLAAQRYLIADILGGHLGCDGCGGKFQVAVLAFGGALQNFFPERRHVHGRAVLLGLDDEGIGLVGIKVGQGSVLGFCGQLRLNLAQNAVQPFVGHFAFGGKGVHRVLGDFVHGRLAFFKRADFALHVQRLQQRVHAAHVGGDAEIGVMQRVKQMAAVGQAQAPAGLALLDLGQHRVDAFLGRHAAQGKAIHIDAGQVRVVIRRDGIRQSLDPRLLRFHLLDVFVSIYPGESRGDDDQKHHQDDRPLLSRRLRGRRGLGRAVALLEIHRVTPCDSFCFASRNSFQASCSAFGHSAAVSPIMPWLVPSP